MILVASTVASSTSRYASTTPFSQIQSSPPLQPTQIPPGGALPTDPEQCHGITQQLLHNKAPNQRDSLSEIIAKQKELRNSVNRNTGNNRISQLQGTLGLGDNDQDGEEGAQNTHNTPANNKKRRGSSRSTTTANKKKKSTGGNMSSTDQVTKLKAELKETKDELKAAKDKIKQQEDIIKLKDAVRLVVLPMFCLLWKRFGYYHGNVLAN